MNYFELLQLLAPEVAVLIGALVVLGLGLSRTQSEGRRTIVLLVVIATGILSGTALILSTESVTLLNGTVVLDPLTRLFKFLILLLGVATVVFARDSNVRDQFAEYISLILFSTIGMMLLAGTEELLMIFVALELTSIPLYVLAGYQKNDRTSAEAALKYFVVGGVSAAFLLFGFSLIYGVAGSTNLRTIAAAAQTHLDPLLAAGIVMSLIGFGFKVAAVPFHLWAPDVYQGAPTSATALVASGSKVAGILVLAKVLTIGLAGVPGSADWRGFEAGWQPLLAIMAVLSLVLGNLGALAQTSVKRLLAYSAIAHSGYMLLALAAAGSDGVSAVLFYVIIYALTTLGAFGVVSMVERHRGGDELYRFAGLRKSAPGLALCMLVFMLSLAGIPPLAGFFGKFYLFAASLSSVSNGVNPPMLWIVILAITFNTISLYYYLIVLKQIFVVEPGSELTAMRGASGSSILIGVLALAVIALGLAPDLCLEPLRTAVNLLTSFN